MDGCRENFSGKQNHKLGKAKAMWPFSKSISQNGRLAFLRTNARSLHSPLLLLPLLLIPFFAPLSLSPSPSLLHSPSSFFFSLLPLAHFS